MKNESKKLILNLVALAAISSSVVSLFAPVTYFDYLDIVKSMGYEKSDFYWTAEIYFLFQDYTIYDHRNIADDVKVAHTYYFMYFFKITTAEWANNYFITSYEIVENKGNIPSSRLLIGMISFVFGGLFLIFLYYFAYKGVKRCEKEKNKYFLYSSIMALVIVSSFTIAIYYFFSWMDIYNIGFIKFLKFSYGFYYMILSAILFFVAYLIQNRIEFSEDTSDKQIDF